jgi:hypothetical protein
VEAAARQYHAQPIALMVDGLVSAYVEAKTTRTEVASALYRVAGELDTTEMLTAISKRIHTAVSGLLASATDTCFDDLFEVTFTLTAAMAGATRVVYERGATRSMVRTLRSELPVMCKAYLAHRACRAG